MLDLRRFFIQQKYYFDLGVSWLVLMNLVLISLNASRILQDYIKQYFGFSIHAPIIIAVLVVVALFGTWGFGYLLDKKVRFMHEMNTVQNLRNLELTKVLNNTEKIIEMLGVKKDD